MAAALAERAQGIPLVKAADYLVVLVVVVHSLLVTPKTQAQVTPVITTHLRVFVVLHLLSMETIEILVVVAEHQALVYLEAAETVQPLAQSVLVPMVALVTRFRLPALRFSTPPVAVARVALVAQRIQIMNLDFSVHRLDEAGQLVAEMAQIFFSNMVAMVVITPEVAVEVVRLDLPTATSLTHMAVAVDPELLFFDTSPPEEASPDLPTL